METVDIRCPVDSRRLFMRLKLAGETPVVTADNLMEFSCDNCRKRLRQEGRFVTHVMHRYDFVGRVVETVIE